MDILKAPCSRMVLVSLLLLGNFAEAKRPPLPQPDPGRGSIGVTIRAVPPGKIGRLTAVQVHFARPAEGEDVLNSEYVVSSNYSNKKQVYLLNAKPGRYVAVAARLSGGGAATGFKYEAFFSKDMLSETEVTVVAGELTFMGEFLLQTSTKMAEADPVQSYFYRLISPEAARKGFLGRAFSGHAPYTATLKNVDKTVEDEHEFWSVAQRKAFKKEPAWQAFAQRQQKALKTGSVPEQVVSQSSDEPSIEAVSDDAEIIEAVGAAVAVAKIHGFEYDTSDSENGRVVVKALWKGRPVTLTMRFFRKMGSLYIASAMEQPGDVLLAGGGQKIEQIFYPDLLQETNRRGLTVYSDPTAQP
ncbi:MAG: hypothetical protein O7C67_01830 [Gammaproteobacteria bacterium]|nr:hypothetical protein [Gammaproteobacteria bacterium]